MRGSCRDGSTPAQAATPTTRGSGAMGLLDGQVAIITGGASGQGAAEARLFAAEGATVVIGDVQDELGPPLAADLGGGARFVHLDGSRDEDWTEVIRCTVDTFGDPTILIQSA